MKIKFSFFTIAGILLFFCGCAGYQSNPVAMDSGIDPSQEAGVADNLQPQPKTWIWGYYDLTFDFENNEVIVSPNRSIEYLLNVVQFLNNSPTGLQISFNGTTPGAGFVDIDMNVGISHPLDIEKFNGYDVKGVFIGNGSSPLDYDSSILYPQIGVDQILLNADGYTRWFNPAEFPTSGIFGYTHGNLASKSYTATATINPYKYFGDGLGATDGLWNYLNSGDPEVGYFLHGTTNYRNYQIRFMTPTPGIKYGYAVIASWAGGDPSDHPAFARETPAVGVVDHSSLWFVSPTDFGGNLDLDLYVYDRGTALDGGVMKDYLIALESTVLSGSMELNTAQMTPIGGTADYHIYNVSIPADNITGLDGNEVWIIICYADGDYSNPYGVPNSVSTEQLRAYYRREIPVDSEKPMTLTVTYPNGGEEFEETDNVEITWTSELVTGLVSIEYSKDNFTSDFHSIALHTDNDGSFNWVVPDDQSDTVKIRVTSDDFPPVSDTSNSYFIILGPSIIVVTPNGGEVIESNSVYEITWTSHSVLCNVDIEYSTDDFVSDMHTIAVDEPNDGSYDWGLVPCVYSSNVKIRVTSSDDPLVYDTSDNGFTVIETGWLRNFGGVGYDSANDVATDYWGNIFVVGDYDVGSDNPDCFLMRLNPCGFADAFKIWGGSSYDGAKDVFVDHSNNVYVCGYFKYTADFDPGSGTDEHISEGAFDWFLSKFDNNCNHLWTITAGSTGTDVATSVFTDSTNRPWVTGYFSGTVDNFDPTDPMNVISAYGGTDGFVAHYTADGDYLYAGNIGGGDDDYVYGIALDGVNNVYFTGNITGFSCDLNPGPGYSSVDSNGAMDVFLAKLNSSGSYQWGKSWGGTEDDYGNALCVDSNSVIYIAGHFMDLVDFDPGSGTDNFLSTGGADAFINVFNTSGTQLGATRWGGTGNDFAYGINLDDDNNLFVTGAYNGTIDFNPYGEPDVHGPGGAYMTRFDAYLSTLFEYSWTRTWGSASGTTGYDVCADSMGNLFTVGKFDGTVDFATSGPPCDEDSDSRNAVAYTDVFIMKRMPDGCS